MKKRIQNRIATGRFTQPVTVGYAIVMLIAGGFATPSHIIQILLLGLSTFLMIVLNNSNSLIRVVSRLVSCSFLALTLMNPTLQESVSGGVVQLFLIIMFLFLFKAYQDRKATGTIFYTFVAIGIISTQFIQILFFVPFIWYQMYTSLQVGSPKVFTASILGIILPYWFWCAYCLYDGTEMAVLEHLISIVELGPIAGGLLQLTLLIPLIFITILGVVGVLHFLTNSFSDNIKTRMLFNSFITLFFVSLVLIILQPQHSDYLLRMMIICISPLVAHYFAFTKSRSSGVFSMIAILAALAITITETWIF